MLPANSDLAIRQLGQRNDLAFAAGSTSRATGAFISNN
jgi:hypothetical protein